MASNNNNATITRFDLLGKYLSLVCPITITPRSQVLDEEAFTANRNAEKKMRPEIPVDSMALQFPELNRDDNTRPYAHSVVRVGNYTDSRAYIAASLVRGYTNPHRRYIVMQGPLGNCGTATIAPNAADTTGAMWELAYEHAEHGGLIVAATNPYENGKSKCARYWPLCISQELHYSERCLSVRMISARVLAQFDNDISLFERAFVVTRNEQARIVRQLHIHNWPDRTVIDARVLAQVIVEMNSLMSPRTIPLIHCSYGVGRASIVVLSHYLHHLFQSGHSAIDLSRDLASMRLDRRAFCPEANKVTVSVQAARLARSNH